MDKTCLKLIECIFHFMDGYPSICDGFSCCHSLVFHCMRSTWPQCIDGHNNRTLPVPISIQSSGWPPFFESILRISTKMSADSRTELCTRSICLSIACGHIGYMLHILPSRVGGNLKIIIDLLPIRVRQDTAVRFWKRW